MGDVFMVASGKGGVGKTTLCAMLGSQFARMDKTVVMLDTNFGLRNLDLYFHLENKIIYNLVDVLKGVCSYRQALLPLDSNRTFYIMPGSRNYDFSLPEDAFSCLIEKLKAQFDIVLIDTPAGITPIHQAMFPYVDQALVVVTMSQASLADALSFCHVLQKQGLPARLIFNQMGPDMAKRRNRSRLQEMARHAFHAEYLGSLPDMHKKCAMPSDFLTRGKEILPICRTILMPAKETE